MIDDISIHALLAESDGTILKLQCVLGNFYPRSPCGERLRGWTLNINGPIFLSTLYYFDFSGLWRDFYPRSPCGERR